MDTELDLLLNNKSLPPRLINRVKELYILIQEDILNNPLELPFNLESLKSLINLYESSEGDELPPYESLTYNNYFCIEFESKRISNNLTNINDDNDDNDVDKNTSITIKCLPNNNCKVVCLLRPTSTSLVHKLINLLM